MKKGERKRGFNSFRKQVRDKPTMTKNIANCISCKFFNSEDECTNPNVTQYDMVYEPDKQYCSFYQGYDYDNGRKEKADKW